MVISKCRACHSLDWVEAWAGVLRCVWCGALLSLRTGTLVKSGDLHRPVVKEREFEVVSEHELTRIEEEPIVSAGLQRPEGWMSY